MSALHGTGLSALVTAVRQHLVPDTDLTHPGPWLFDDRLADQRRGPTIPRVPGVPAR